MDKEIIYMMALTRLSGISIAQQRLLVEKMGSATSIYEHRKDILDIVPDALPVLRDNLMKMDDWIARCEEEWEWAEKRHVRCISILDGAYPQRLKECADAPLVLYYRGCADLNKTHIVSMVGTRKITEYGKGICDSFVKELAALCPDVLVMSGLAYGVDIHSHRASMKYGLETIGVLAHGLDQIYPTMHRNTAIEMLSQGGLLTEYMSRTAIDKRNFVQRNRIVAGCADATIVVESASKGGSLITARIAQGYAREVFAFPGRITDPQSAGCNRLIATDGAHALANAKDLCEAMGWLTELANKKALEEGIQQELFPDLSPEEQAVVDVLRKKDEIQINVLSVNTNISISRLTSLLFSLEIKGVVKALAGARYCLRK